MKYAWMLILSIILNGSTTNAAESTNVAEKVVINFNLAFVLSCKKKPNQTECLRNIFGPNAVFDTDKNKAIRSIDFHYVKDTKYLINGLSIQAKGRLKIQIHEDRNSYRICNVKFPVSIGRMQINGTTCLCGFNGDGSHDLKLHDSYSFLPDKAKLTISGIACDKSNTLLPNHIKLISRETSCGYEFPAGTIFELNEGSPGFVAKSNGKIDNSNGQIVSVEIGSRFISDGNRSSVCAWRKIEEL